MVLSINNLTSKNRGITMFGFFKKTDEAPKKKRPYKPIKVVGGGNPWQKRNAKYAKQDAKREKRQDRTGNK